jgi:hypothetical protein
VIIVYRKNDPRKITLRGDHSFSEKRRGTNREGDGPGAHASGCAMVAEDCSLARKQFNMDRKRNIARSQSRKGSMCKIMEGFQGRGIPRKTIPEEDAGTLYRAYR